GPRNLESKRGGPSGARGPVANKIEPLQEDVSFGAKVAQMNTDYQIAFANAILSANVAAVQVSISVENGDGQKSSKIQEDLQSLWEQTVPAMMDSIGFGRVAFEKEFEYDAAGPCTYIKKLEAVEFEDSR